jgi:hypothetical protein
LLLPPSDTPASAAEALAEISSKITALIPVVLITQCEKKYSLIMHVCALFSYQLVQPALAGPDSTSASL